MDDSLLASGDDCMEPLLAFLTRLQHVRNLDSGFRDKVRMNGADRNVPLTMEGRKQLLKELLALQEQTGLRLITDDELLLIQQIWKGARAPDDGRGVARIVNEQRGLPMNDNRQTSHLPCLEAQVAENKGLNADTLQRLVAKVKDYSEMQRAHGLQSELQHILQDGLSAGQFGFA